MSLNRQTLGTAPLEIIDGDRGASYPQKNDFMEQGFCLFLNTGNVTPTGFSFDKCQFISEAKDAELRKGKLLRGDVVLTTRGTIGNSALFGKSIEFDQVRINSGMVILRADNKRLRSEYLYLYLRSRYFKDEVERLRSGAAQPQLPIRDLKQAIVEIPPIHEQDAITEKIWQYDDLIETNRRRIDLLEESARLMYREWFVNLRYPASSTPSGASELPEGWVIKPLAEVAVVNRASLGSKSEIEDIQYVDIASVETGIVLSTSKMPYSEAPGRARRLVQHGDVIWSCVRPNRRSYALLWEPDDDVVVSTGFAVLTASSVPFSYLYFATTSNDFVAYLTNRATGAAYPAVSGKDFEEAPLLCPSPHVLQDFHGQCLPVLELRSKLISQNVLLSEARDRLLPKLMSGEIQV